MNRNIHFFVLSSLLLAGCFGKDSNDDEGNTGTGDGGWWGNVYPDGGGTDDTGTADGGTDDDGGTDGGTSGDGGGAVLPGDSGSPDGGSPDGGSLDGGTDGLGTDDDGDGFTEGEGDCNDGNDAIYPEAPDVWYDGVDSNCDGWNDYDADRDGYASNWYGGADCNDSDSDINPSRPETENDGIDRNCSGNDDEWGGLTHVTEWYSTHGSDEIWVSNMESVAGTFLDYFGYAREIEGSCADPDLRFAVYDTDTTGEGEAVGLIDYVGEPGVGSSWDDYYTECTLCALEGCITFDVLVW